MAAPEPNGRRLYSYVASTGEKWVLVPTLTCGELYAYKIPSFSVVTVLMRRITCKYQLLLQDGKPKVVDGFIREELSLKRFYPAQVSVEVNPKFAMNVEVCVMLHSGY